MEFSSPFFIRWKVDSPKDFDGFSQNLYEFSRGAIINLAKPTYGFFLNLFLVEN